MRARCLAMISVLGLWSAAAVAGQAQVVDASAQWIGGDRLRIDVTIRHADEGWDHYADRWDVLAPDGTLLGARTLYHPHVDEQPFTRSLTIQAPSGLKRVSIRAHDSVHGPTSVPFELDLPAR